MMVANPFPLLRDIRHALRVLAKSPGFAVVALLTLALGIGATTAIYGLVDTLAFRMFPPSVREPDRIVWMFETSGEVDTFRDDVAAANFADWRAQTHTLEALTALRNAHFTLTGQGEPEWVKGFAVSADYFKVMGLGVARGRMFTAEEEQAGRDDVVILGDGFWKRRFGADPGVVGKPLVLDGRTRRVIGILPEDYNFPRHCNVLVPLVLGPTEWKERGTGAFAAIGRLAQGVSLAGAHAELDVISERLGNQYPTTNRGLRVRLVPLHELFAERGPLVALMAAVTFVLLIACANVANLELARGTERRRELAVRQALGATRSDLLRLLFAETLVLAVAGGALGIVLAHGMHVVLLANLPNNLKTHLPWILKIGISPSVLAFAAAATIAAALLSGLAPALRTSRLELYDVLKDAAPSAGRSAEKRRLASALVIGEVALALALLAGAGVTIRSFLALSHARLGFRAEGVIAVDLPLDARRYADDEARGRRIAELVRNVGAVPGAVSASAASDPPMSPTSSKFRIEGLESRPNADLPLAHTYAVTSDYFATLEIPVVRGRVLSHGERASSIVVSDNLVRTFFPGEDPIGKHLRLEWDESEHRAPREIVGVVGAQHEPRLSGHAAGDIYFPIESEPSAELALFVRGPTGEAFTQAVRNAIVSSDPDQVIEEMTTLERVVTEMRSSQRVLVALLAAMAGLALALASIGVYGVVSYNVQRRTREVGIRLALGAPRQLVLRLVLRDAMALSASGIAIGSLVALPLVRALVATFYLGSSARQLSMTDASVWIPLAGVAALLALVTLVASAMPARRATEVDPMVALRCD